MRASQPLAQRMLHPAPRTKNQERGRAAWLCHQLGSREHYSIPRALHLSHNLGLLQTDSWVRPDWQWLPKALGQGALAARFHEDLSSAAVHAFTLGRVSFDLGARLRKKDTWTTIRERDIWFQDRCLPQLGRSLAETETCIVFSYAYTAQQLFQFSKARGAVCVLGQIDPGPGETIHLKSVLPKETAAQIEERPENYWAAWREEIDLADRIVVNSAWSRDLLVQYSAVPEEKIRIIPLAYTPEGIEVPKSYPERFTKDRPLKLLFLGQVIHRKGVHLLLEAMERLAHQPIHLDLAGPLDPSTLDARLLPSPQVSALRPQPSIRLTIHGTVDRERARQLYREADVFILPTLSDGFAITQLEAASYRLPLIVSQNCAQVVRDHENGIVLEEVSARVIEEALGYCLAHPEELERWSRCELDWEEYSLEKLGERLVGMVEDFR